MATTQLDILGIKQAQAQSAMTEANAALAAAQSQYDSLKAASNSSNFGRTPAGTVADLEGYMAARNAAKSFKESTLDPAITAADNAQYALDQASNDLTNAENASKQSASSKTAGDVVAGEKTDKTGTDSSKASGAEALSKADEKKIDSSDKQEKSDEVVATAVKPPDETDGKELPVVATTTIASASDIPAPVPNPLHNYATYTYGLTLFVLGRDDYNELVNGTASNDWDPKYSLVSSASNYHQNRHKFFEDDFYFDNLKTNTIIGMNAGTRGSNAIELSFNLIEPYGLTLMDRLIDLANDPDIGTGNYVAQPYLLQIDFFGSDELGSMQTPIPNLRKRIPINFIEFKIKVGTRGTEYAIRAIPYNHQAFNESINSSPADFEVGSNNVKDFFDAVIGESIQKQMSQKSDQRAESESMKQDIANAEMFGETARVTELKKDQATLEKNIKTPYSTTSYAGAWNAWEQKVTDDKHTTYPNEIEFVFDDEIGNSLIGDPKKQPILSAPMGSVGPDGASAKNKGNNTAVSDKTPSNAFDPSKKIFNIASGTSIVDIINLVMKNSDYIKKQLVDPLNDKSGFKEDAEVNYFKIVPKLYLKEFDPLRGEYAKKITYYVKKYTYINTKHPALPKSKPKGAVKEYNYIYTGKNIDILDLQIDFDSAFFTTIVVNREKIEATSGAPSASDGEADPDKTKKPVGNGSISPMVHRPQGAEATASSSGAETAVAVLASSAMKSIYSGSRGDMLNIKLKIIGDPHFIKQDDIYTNPGHSDYDSSKMMINDSSLVMDSGEIFCTINFKTPVDMDDNTGLMREDSKYSTSKFSGYYKIMTVESEFSKGQFVQTLDLIRIFDDNASASKERPDGMNNEDVRNAELFGLNKEESQPPKQALPVQQTTKEEAHSTKSAEADKTDQFNPEKSSAAAEGKKISDDLKDAKEVEIKVYKVSDLNSPMPVAP